MATVYMLGIIDRHGARWFALDDRRAGPMSTRDPLRAHKWESAEAVLDWLESIPEVVTVKGEEAKGGRAWMDRVEFLAVPVSAAVGEPIPLFRYEAPTLEGASR